ncbi:MAG: glutamate-1-semialdehyde 2,1-aminomutase [Acidimicrobiales bacterium]
MSARATPRTFDRSIELTRRLEAIVPGGAHTYAKAADQYPEDMAPVIAHGTGAHVWDVDGNEYIEFGAGLRSVALGHAHPRVLAAVTAVLADGSNFVRPSAIELDAASALLGVAGDVDMVKFAKNGSDATTAAVKLARAATGRDLVAICRDHPFFSTDDWFIGAGAMPAGVPKRTRDQTLSFAYGDLDETEALFEAHPGEVAAIVLEPMTAVVPSPDYFSRLRRLCDEHGVLMIIDEMITGFRLATGAFHPQLGAEPDLVCFGKALGNGFSVSALAGRRRYMRLGGFDHDEERVFLLSTTHGAETHALAAALAVIDTHFTENVPAELQRIGTSLAERATNAIEAAGVADHLRVVGNPANLIHATLDGDGQRSQPFRTLFMAELLKRGVIAPSFVVSTALTDDDIEATADAVYEAGLVYRRALDNGIETELVGRPVQPAIRPRG